MREREDHSIDAEILRVMEGPNLRMLILADPGVSIETRAAALDILLERESQSVLDTFAKVLRGLSKEPKNLRSGGNRG